MKKTTNTYKLHDQMIIPMYGTNFRSGSSAYFIIYDDAPSKKHHKKSKHHKH